jgi:hypothetical protein
MPRMNRNQSPDELCSYLINSSVTSIRHLSEEGMRYVTIRNVKLSVVPRVERLEAEL